MVLSRRRFVITASSALMLAPPVYTFSATEILADKKERSFRDYDAAPEHVTRFYAEHHRHQTYDFASSKRENYGRLQQGQYAAWEMMEQLDKIKDESDPDISLSQMEHAFQVAESIHQKGHPEWMVVAGLLHDMGKALLLWGEPQWAVVGDTYPTGLRFSESIVQYPFLADNPDSKVAAYQSDYGIYHEGIGLDNVIMTWGHDEYLYQVLRAQSSLPEEALFAIRFHSCYPLLQAREPRYLALMNNDDRRLFSAVLTLNQHDLYSKSDTSVAHDPALQKHYKSLVEKYIPGKIHW
ncbi:inositol oxygenase family protein [Endozoicomonadaceae bacterium StTr2]